MPSSMLVPTRWNGEEVEFLRAGPADVPRVLDVLHEAAEWLWAQGVDQWPLRFHESWIEPAISRGETWLVYLGGALAATMTIDWEDPLWIDEEGEAGYLHRTAVRRWAAGLGRCLLDRAADFARGHGCGRLRLDCVVSNVRLRAYCEEIGFVHRGGQAVGGVPGERVDDGANIVVSRYEFLTGRQSW